MLGQMMHTPLSIAHIANRIEQESPQSEVVSLRADGSTTRRTYRDISARARRLANALHDLGVRAGDRVATLCWNHAEHLEAYLAIPAMGAVVHTLNLRLHPNQLAYIANHAEDSVLIVDRSLLPLLAQFHDRVHTLKTILVVNDGAPVKPLSIDTLDYEAQLDKAQSEFEWPVLDEHTAAMLCYTSGTTGEPKGVLYSHRSTLLHALVASLPDHLGCGHSDIVLPVVPMFHAAAWGLPYIAMLTGAKLVFPGRHLGAQALIELIERERVTIAGGVPTIWLEILATLDANPDRYDLSCIRRMAIGGSAAPPSLIAGFKERHGLEVLHAWGMTETSPVGTIARVKPHLASDFQSELPHRASQGCALPLFETRYVDGQGNPLEPGAGQMGELEVRGPWVASSYYGGVGTDRFTKDGWFRTGDIVTVDSDRYITITDRSKDVIKSGGEWISSVAVENALMSHPSVLEAAVFAGHHPKWDERPIAAIVCKNGENVTEDELNDHIRPLLASYWLPDAYVFLSAIPRTSTGKFLKSKLRADYGDLLR